MKTKVEVAIKILKEWRAGRLTRNMVVGLLDVAVCSPRQIELILGPEPKSAEPKSAESSVKPLPLTPEERAEIVLHHYRISCGWVQNAPNLMVMVVDAIIADREAMKASEG